MLTENQKQQIAELAAERDRAYAAADAQRHAETAARRAENLVHWQPVLDAARAALPEWLTAGGRLEPVSSEDDLGDRWVKLAENDDCYTNHTAAVELRDANDDHILTIVMRRKPDEWTPESYHVIDGDDYSSYKYTNLELALVRLPAEDEKRRSLAQTAAQTAADKAKETTYAEYKAQAAARAAADAQRRAQFEAELIELMDAAETCIGDAARIDDAADAALVAQLSLAQSAAAIARILNDWRLTARESAQGNC